MSNGCHCEPILGEAIWAKSFNTEDHRAADSGRITSLRIKLRPGKQGATGKGANRGKGCKSGKSLNAEEIPVVVIGKTFEI